jgi:NAD-dependent DNA ligase
MDMSVPVNQHNQPVSTRLNAAYRASRDISEFVGLCKGVLADAVINQREAEFVLQWLDLHPDVHGLWPTNVVREALDRFLEDGLLSTDEESSLLEIMVGITGAPIKVNQKTGELHQNASTELPLCEPESLCFPEKQFVLTGRFEIGGRSTLERWVQDLGGKVQKVPTQATHYLVVGAIGSRDWAHSSFGRKIEKAVFLKEAGQEIYIIGESFFTSGVEKARNTLGG